MSQCPSRERGKDARPRAEIPVLKWLLCLSPQRGILKASPSLALSSPTPPPPPQWGRGPGAHRPPARPPREPADLPGGAPHPHPRSAGLLPLPHPCRGPGLKRVGGPPRWGNPEGLTGWGGGGRPRGPREGAPAVAGRLARRCEPRWRRTGRSGGRGGAGAADLGVCADLLRAGGSEAARVDAPRGTGQGAGSPAAAGALRAERGSRKGRGSRALTGGRAPHGAVGVEGGTGRTDLSAKDTLRSPSVGKSWGDSGSGWAPERCRVDAV